MLQRLRQRAARAVEFCEECGRVCTAECIARARMDRLRGELAVQMLPRQ